ncbi:unnamed protein product [Caretta caretta]
MLEESGIGFMTPEDSTMPVFIKSCIKSNTASISSLPKNMCHLPAWRMEAPRLLLSNSQETKNEKGNLYKIHIWNQSAGCSHWVSLLIYTGSAVEHFIAGEIYFKGMLTKTDCSEIYFA